MILLYKIVIISFLLTLFIETTFSVQGRPDKTVPIKCYQCNSFYDRGCADFFDNRTYPLIPCNWNASQCRKIIQETWYEDHWDVRYIRQCAKYGEVGPAEGRWCKERSGGFRTRLKICQCDNKDGCNGAIGSLFRDSNRNFDFQMAFLVFLSSFIIGWFRNNLTGGIIRR